MSSLPTNQTGSAETWRPWHMPEWLRMLTTRIPADWRDLQTAVADILAQSGFSVQVEKVIQTVRGHAEIDVFGQEAVEGRTCTVLCECKNWAARVVEVGGAW